MELVKIFDTTLRDGEQSPGASMNIDEKVRIALALERLGVDIIEAGFAASSPGDFEAIAQISSMVKDSTICSLSRCLESDIVKAADALKNAKRGRIHVFIATSPIHMEFKLKMAPDAVLKRAAESVAIARNLCADVEFSCEDAMRSDIGFLKETIAVAIEAGATTINIPDTVGYRMPWEVYGVIKELREFVDAKFGGQNITLSVHCHNDLGMAVANSIEGIKAGARQVECTINGLGERAGNTALEEVVMILKTRKDLFGGAESGAETCGGSAGCGADSRADSKSANADSNTSADSCPGLDTRINTRELYATSKLVADTTGIIPQPNKAIVGKNAFAHESGIHQDGMLKHRETYEIMRPEDIGIPQNSGLVLGKHSGRAAFRDKVASLGFCPTDAELESAFAQFKELCDNKKEVFDEDIRAILSESAVKIPQVFSLALAQVSSCSSGKHCGAVSIFRDGIEFSDSALGNGAVDCVLKSIDRASGIKGNLRDYRVEAVSSGKDALAKVVVKVEFEANKPPLIGHAIDIDTVSATAKAYVSALNSYLSMKDLIANKDGTMLL